MGARAQGGHRSWARAEAACAPAVASSWQVSSFSEARAQQILQQKPARYLCFNQNQLSRVYPSSYRVDSSNFNPQPFWNAGCQMGGCRGVAVLTRGFGEPPVASSRLGLGVGVPQDPRARWELRRVCHACPGCVGGRLCQALRVTLPECMALPCSAVSPRLCSHRLPGGCAGEAGAMGAR